MKTEKTRIVFRKWNDGEIIAIFPDMPENNGMVMSYMHTGQHSGCTMDIIHESFHAYPREYAALKKELESIGYNLKVDNSFKNELKERYDCDYGYIVVVGKGYRVFSDSKSAIAYAEKVEGTYMNMKKRVVMRFPLF